MWQGIFTDQAAADTGIAASPEYFTNVSGEGYFSFWHVVFIVAAFLIWGVLWLALRRKKQLETVVLATAAAVVLSITAALLLYSAFTGIYNYEWYIPLHICNLFAVILPLSLAFRKVRNFCKDFIVFFGIGGGVTAIVFPITSGIYMGHLHPVSILIWFYHVAIAALGGYYIVSGLYRNFNAFTMLGILTFLIIGSLIMNRFTGSDFLFINPARRVQPLTAFVSVFGEAGVWAVIGLVYAGSVSLHFAWKWFYRRRERTLRQIFAESWFVRKIAASRELTETLSDMKEYFIGQAGEVNRNVKNRAVRKVFDLTERFVLCVKNSGIVSRLMDTPLGEIADTEHLAAVLTESGLLKSLAAEFNMPHIKNLHKLPCEEMLQRYRNGTKLLPAGFSV